MNMHTWLRGLLLAAVLYIPFVSNTQASFQQALELYQEGEFEPAYHAFEALAAIADRSALFNLGVMHYRGEYVEQDLEKGYALMSIANRGYDNENFSSLLKGTSNNPVIWQVERQPCLIPADSPAFLTEFLFS
jgi:TPR repeat protein